MAMQLPKIATREPRSLAGVERQYYAVIRAYIRAYSSGGAFGFDWPTMRINWPEGFARCKELEAIAKAMLANRSLQ
jgi:hypothetical protein